MTRCLGLALLGFACSSEVQVAEPLEFDVDVRVVVSLGAPSEVVSLGRTEAFVREDQVPVDRWLLGYRSKDLPWPALRGRADVAQLLRPRFGGEGLEAPPPAQLFSIAGGADRWGVSDWGSFGQALTASANGPLRFDVDPFELCLDAERDFDVFDLSNPAGALSGSFGQDCGVKFGISADQGASLCPDPPIRYAPTGELVLQSGSVCPPIAAPLGADLAFECPPGTCSSSDSRSLGLQFRTPWTFATAGFITSSPALPHNGVGIAMGDGVLYAFGTARGTEFVHLTAKANAIDVRPLDLVIQPQPGYFATFTKAADESRVLMYNFVYELPNEALIMDYAGGQLTNYRAFTPPEPHSFISLSRDGRRVYSYTGSGLVSWNAETFAELSRTQNFHPSGAPESRSIAVVDSLEGERIIACVAATDAVAYCQGEGVEIFDSEARLLYTVVPDRSGTEAMHLGSVIDGPRLVYRTRLSGGGPNEAIISIVEPKSGARTDYAVPIWFRGAFEAEGKALYIEREALFRSNGQEWLIFRYGDVPVALDLASGRRSYTFPSLPHSFPFIYGLFHDSAGMAWSIAAYGRTEFLPDRLELAKIAPPD